MTTLTEPLLLAPAFVGGLVLGTAYQLALWWTVIRGLAADRAAFWFPASLLLRLGVMAAGFWVIGAGRWERFLVCLGGFLLAQMLVIRFAPRAAVRLRPDRSIDHAS